MAVPRLYLDPNQFRSGELELRNDDAHYVKNVLRLRAGDSLTLFDGAGAEAEATIVEIGQGRVRLRAGVHEVKPALSSVRITLLCALQKGEKMDWVVQKTTELGLTCLQPVISERSVPRVAADHRINRWQRIARDAARQSGRADIPAIISPRPLSEALMGPFHGDSTRIIAHPHGGLPIAQCLARLSPEVVLLVGPEGGFAPREVTLSENAGFQLGRVGRLIMRAETAAIVACAAVTIVADLSEIAV